MSESLYQRLGVDALAVAGGGGAAALDREVLAADHDAAVVHQPGPWQQVSSQPRRGQVLVRITRENREQGNPKGKIPFNLR